MVAIPLGVNPWRREVAQDPEIRLVNRYFEKNPTNQIDQVSLIARPGLEAWKTLGEGPIRGMYSQPGSFSDALFVVSNTNLYRVDTNDSDTLISTGITGTSLNAAVSMAATSAIGTTPEYLFLADGSILWCYIENGYAHSLLTGTPANGDKVTIGTAWYQWTTGSVDTGSPAGTSSDPWLVNLGSGADAMTNLALALDALGVAGTDYSTALTAHPTVTQTGYDATTLAARARDAGAGGNTIATTETGAALAWSGSTLSGGGSPVILQVIVPDDLAVKAVAYIKSFVLVVVAAGQGVNGRFFWIRPGATRIEPLDFATAETLPDTCHSVRVIGDQAFFFGPNSTEAWYPTGQESTEGTTLPFAPSQGQVFTAGVWEGTDVLMNDGVALVDMNGQPWFITPSGANPIGTPGIVERIRQSQMQQLLTP